MASLFDIVLAPPRMAARALDDLHKIAVGTAAVGGLARELGPRIEPTVQSLGGALSDLHRIADQVEGIHQVLHPLEDRVHGLEDAFSGSNEELCKLRHAFKPHFEALEETTGSLAGDLALMNAELAALRRQVGGQISELEDDISDVRDTVQPLQGAARRVGRVVERLPGPGRQS